MPGRLPWMPFYPADYLLDTRPLTLAERGLWMDLLCVLWREDTRGSGTYPADVWAGKCSCSVEQFLTHLQGIKYHAVGLVSIVNDVVSIQSRRMTREQTRREQNKLAQQKHRQQSVSMPSSAIVISHSQKSESELEKKDRIGRACAFPKDWLPDPRMVEFAQTFALNPHAEFQAFKDHHESKGSVFKDWPAAYRTWIRKAVSFKKGVRP